MKLIYEWDYETVEDGDVIDHDHSDKLADFSEDRKTDTLVLVRNEGSEEDGLTDREWAYVVDGKLPDYFQDARGVNGSKVPIKYHQELKKYLSVTQ